MKNILITQSNRPVGETEITINLDQVRCIEKVYTDPNFQIKFLFTDTSSVTWTYDSEADRDAEFALIR